ncbi:unnamed protein product [Nyctereutes procyonoides]|uniref:Septin-2 n=1 Tax=Nyctereutes procyonoides TaxID=34880 RepID=A0A811Y7M7_NYCPR|nr:unnamed protein product [Nyctereutes procyonoides]
MFVANVISKPVLTVNFFFSSSPSPSSCSSSEKGVFIVQKYILKSSPQKMLFSHCPSSSSSSTSLIQKALLYLIKLHPNVQTVLYVSFCFINPETPGYVGFANLPNQVHRKSVKKGFEFTLMVVGESGLGKSTLINSLFLTDLYPERIIPGAAEKIERAVQIEASTVEIEEQGVKLHLTVVDTPGYGDAINRRDCFKTIISYIDEQFERYLHDESRLNRRHIIHNRCTAPLDVAFMKAIHNKVNIVPVIAKADTLTLKERERLKKRILDEIEEHNIKIYHLPDAESDEDEDFKEQTRLLKASIPFSVVGSNQLIEAKGKKVRGRLYPWGVVEVENPEHNDFLKLRTMLITHMQDLQEVTQDLHYGNFHSERLKRGGRKVENEDMNKDQILLEKEAELRRMQEMIARMQAQMQLQMQGGDADGGVHGHHV